ncbi:ABC transporter ATP-binding protein [Methylococcus sp. EFPC2]|uniref:ABC transporter ATP-binding protein n=1 Tax=Methylococcus sp. EFPC2 TaxID=2812648 RepID=UPI001966E1A6|nr:ABC transporter ATP-binding protein [Methylococcus sp. EFPC2]QSA95590.1 ABC transporter ATP-binding protein [Methylococcus sp. EFPC2]
MAIIEIDHVTKEYTLGHLTNLRATLANGMKRILGQPTSKRERFLALDDISFNIETGEVVGIIGHNGAGKSTLLKMLASISRPTRGRVTVNGRIAPLIEVGAGFVPDFSGRENVYLNGSILGLSKKEIDKKFDDIVDFAELSQFIDTPVKRYSSGMQVRLAFAVATSIDAEILIVDEVLAVGDIAFQRKCFDRMENMIKRDQKTVLIVSHNIRQIERICSRVVLLEKGKVIADGSAKDTCNLFYEKSDEKIKKQSTRVSSTCGTDEIDLIGIELYNQDGQTTDTFEHNEDIKAVLKFNLKMPLKSMCIGVGVHTPDLLYLANADSIDDITYRNISPGILEVVCNISKIKLWPGIYSIRIGIAEADADRNIFYGENLFHFQIVSSSINRTRTIGQGFFPLECSWQLLEHNKA